MKAARTTEQAPLFVLTETRVVGQVWDAPEGDQHPIEAAAYLVARRWMDDAPVPQTGPGSTIQFTWDGVVHSFTREVER